MATTRAAVKREREKADRAADGAGRDRSDLNSCRLRKGAVMALYTSRCINLD